MNGKITIGCELTTKQFDAQIKVLKNKLNDIEASLQMASKDKTLFSTREIEEMEAEAEKLRNKIGSLQEDFKKTNKKTSKGFDKCIKSLNRFALSIFSVGSVFAVISKSSSAYLSQNEELAKKLQNVWLGLGSFMEPILTLISDALLKGLGYLNVFIKALTGIDYIAKANAKALEKQTKAQKELNKQMGQFDEATVLTNNNTSTNTNATNLIEIPELDENIIKKLQDLAYWLKENWDWIWKVGLVLGTVFGIVEISKILQNIDKLIGTTSGGLNGLLSVLKFLGTIGVIAIGVDLVYKTLTGRDLINDLKEIKDGLSGIANQNKNQISNSKSQTKRIKEIIDSKKEEIDTWKRGSSEVYAFTNQLDGAIASYEKSIERNKEWKDGLHGISKTMATLDGSINAHKESSKEYIKQIDTMVDSYKYLYDQGKLNVEQTNNYKKALELQKTAYENLYNQLSVAEKAQYTFNDSVKATTDDVTIADEVVGGLGNALQNISKNPYSVKINTNFEVDKTKLQNILDKLTTNANTVFGGLGIKLLPIKLAKGGIVNQPGRGVPLTSAVSGERGQEGVVPLTDSQQMALLGEAIGKYVRIDNVIDVNMDSRRINRILQSSNDRVNFANNR